MFAFHKTALVAAIVLSFQGLADAGFQTSTDDGILASVGSLEATPAPQALADSGYSAGPYSGPVQVFTATAANPFIGIEGFISNLEAGLIEMYVDGLKVAEFQTDVGVYGHLVVEALPGESFQSLAFKSKNYDADPDNATAWVANGFSFAYADSVVPEPASMALFGLGALSLLGGYGRRRKKDAHAVA